MTFSKKKVLVTGGAGFVGSHLVERLIALDAVVTVFDNLSTGQECNIPQGASLIIGESRQINDLVSDAQDFVFHLGEYSRVEQSFEDIDIVFEANLASIYSVLKFCSRSKAKLVYAGSSTKFGDDGETRFQTPYALTKSLNTEVVKAYCDWFDLEFAITYFYNVYGEREISCGKYATLVAKFLEMRKQGIKELPVVSPGTQLRNFTHVDDIIDGLILVASHGQGDGYGIGSDEALSVLEVVQMLGCSPIMIEERRGNRKSAPVNSAMTKKLGWSPSSNLKDYISQELSSNA